MAKRRILIIGDEGIAIFLSDGKKVEHECTFPWSLPDFENKLTDILKNKNSSVPLFILYDALEQQYRKENIIKTNILDQKKLVTRKLNTLFPNVLSYSYMQLKNGKKEKNNKKSNIKKNISYLIAAVPNTEQMDKIEHIITDVNCNISGFALLPIESSSFAKEFTKKIAHKGTPLPRWTLLITHHETGGLRQIFIKDGELILTRLTPLASEEGNGPGWAEEVYKGFTTTISYISRFGFSSSDGLDVIVICNNENKSLLRTYDFKNANLHCYSIKDVEKLFNFTLPKQLDPNSQFTEMLHAGWLARQRKLIMPFKIGWIQNIAIPKKTAKSLAFLLFLAVWGLAFMSFDTWQKYQDIKKEITYKESNRLLLEKEYEEESKIFDNLPIRPAMVKATIETKEILNKNSMISYTILDKIHKAIGNKAQILEIEYNDNRIVKDKFNKKNTYIYKPPSKIKKHVNHLNIKVKFTLKNQVPVEEQVVIIDSIKEKFIKMFPKHIVELRKQHDQQQSKIDIFAGSLGDNVNDNDVQNQNINSSNSYTEISISGEQL